MCNLLQAVITVTYHRGFPGMGFKALALALAEELDCDIKTVELDAAPWVVDSLVKRRK